MDKKKKKRFCDQWICNDAPKPITPEIAAMTDEEAESEFYRLFGQYLPDNSQIVKDQYEFDKYTILFFDNLKMANASFVKIEQVIYKIVVCFDLPDAFAIEAKGDFKGKKVFFVKE